ncbi:MAG TPA: hypothetical protein VNG69_00545 [Casimicrobiaceae bacterium]|nr:hypothetical protein [Casimicrobiaceae bacterium]
MALWACAVAAVPDAFAQACDTFTSGIGRDLFCHSEPQGFDCDRSGCHTGASSTNDVNRIHRAAGSPSAIQNALATVPAMQATFTFGSALNDSQIEAIAAFIGSWFSGGPPPPPPPNPQPPTPPATPPIATIVEYLHATFGHYFITNIVDEITALDAGRFEGWKRTGKTFNAYASTNGAQIGVCRFFTVAFPPKSSHFYTAIQTECQAVQANRDWTFEAAAAFYALSADVVTGACPTGTQPVYRLYNEGQGGAPNHRYTVELAVRSEMLARGYRAEGHGPEGIGFCAPL